MQPNDDNESVLYEVSLEADAAITGPFDTWLRDHIADMLQFQGFQSAEILDDSGAADGRIRRIVQYRLRDQAALDAYLRDEAPRMRQEGVARFGDRFSAQRRMLAHREEFIRGAVSTENCLNCGEVLTGQHCSHCGQRSRVRVLSLTSLLRDLFGDLTEFDSRIWRTMRPLLFKPGLLTVEYLRGRRTHYSPPFRMYLVLSLVFFLAASLNTDPGGGLQFGVGPDGASLRIPGDGASPAATDEAAAPAAATDATTIPADVTPGTRPDAAAAPSDTPPQPVAAPADNTAAALDEKRRQLIERFVSRLPPAERERARQEFEKEFGRLTSTQIEPVSRLLDDPCGADNIRLEIGPLGDTYEPRLREACRKIMADSKSFGRALYENIPKMMFIFLPLIAALMFVLYIGSGRYYVEHLLFFVHYHSFFFAGGIVIILLDALTVTLDTGAVASAVRVVQGVVTGLFVLYVPFYLHRAMRRVYGQGRWVTFTKFSLLGIGYLFFMTLTAIGLLFYTALTL